MLVFYTDGNKEDIGQDMKVAFSKEYVLFEQQVLHHKAQHMVIDFDNIKDGDTIVDDSEPDMTIEKVTYLYYVYKQGEKNGLMYNEAINKTKSFSVDTLFKQSNLGSENEQRVSLVLGEPNKIKKQGEKWTEKYYNFKEIKNLDTVFRVYDDTLKDIPFSISKRLDQEKNSKLTKSLQLIKIPPSLEMKQPLPLKLELLTEMELVTQKISKAQLEKIKRYFEKYEQDIIKEPIKN